MLDLLQVVLDLVSPFLTSEEVGVSTITTPSVVSLTINITGGGSGGGGGTANNGGFGTAYSLL